MVIEHKSTASRTPYLMASNRTLTVGADQAAAYGITTSQETVTIADVGDMWVERVLGAWIVAGRLAPDDRGEPVIAELRIFPFESYRPDRFLGRWGAEVLGVEATGVPRGGISATFVRRQVGAQVTHFERTAAEGIAAIGRIGRATIADEDGRLQPFNSELAEFANALRAVGFNIKRKLEDLVKRPAHPRASGASGRPPIPDLDYARMSVAYAAAAAGGRRPVPELVRLEFAKTPAAAKSMIARARKKGLLSAPPQNGKAGGEATQAAEDLIAQSATATAATESRPHRQVRKSHSPVRRVRAKGSKKEKAAPSKRKRPRGSR